MYAEGDHPGDYDYAILCLRHDNLGVITRYYYYYYCIYYNYLFYYVVYHDALYFWHSREVRAILTYSIMCKYIFFFNLNS